MTTTPDNPELTERFQHEIDKAHGEVPPQEQTKIDKLLEGKQHKEKKENELSYVLAVNGEVLEKVQDGEGVPQFLHRVLDKFCDWKEDIFAGQQYGQMKADVLAKYKLLDYPEAKRLCKKFFNISDSNFCFLMDTILAMIRPSIHTQVLRGVIPGLMQGLAAKNPENMPYDLMKDWASKWSEEECKAEFEKHFDAIKFTYPYLKDNYYEVLQIFYTGVIHNMFLPELKERLETEDHYFQAISQQQLDKIKKVGSYNLQPFNGFLVLCGRQNTGKSYSIKHLLPQSLNQYVQEGSNLLPSKDELNVVQAKQISGKIILNLEDLSLNDFKRMNETLKNQLDRTQWNYRHLYQTQVRTLLRRFSLFATTNQEQIIFDETGNRRVFPIQIQEIDRDKANSVSKEKMWAYFYMNWCKNPTNVLNWYSLFHNMFDAISNHHHENKFANFKAAMRGAMLPYELQDEETQETLIAEMKKVIRVSKSDSATIVYFLSEESYGYVPLSFSQILDIMDAQISDRALGKHLKDSAYITDRWSRRTKNTEGLSSVSAQRYAFIRKTSSVRAKVDANLTKQFGYGSNPFYKILDDINDIRDKMNKPVFTKNEDDSYNSSAAPTDSSQQDNTPF